MTILLWILLGALAGWIASTIMRTNASQGVLGDIVVGIIGAVLGGLVMSLFGQPGVSGFNLYSIVVAVLGAVILLWITRAFRRTVNY
jgi:uncharacterized membrane protein YeaQ/YmgE (transglycosylase-associated protein family)